MRTVIALLMFSVFSANVIANDDQYCSAFKAKVKITKEECKSDISKVAERLCKRGKYDAALRALGKVAEQDNYYASETARFEYQNLLQRLYLLHYPNKRCYSGKELSKQQAISHAYTQSLTRVTFAYIFDYK